MSGRPHPPTEMRALMQEWKHGRAVRELIPVARSIGEPSFAAEALFALATDPALPEKDAEHVALEALRFVDKVERDWRRGEALANMSKRLPEFRRHPAAAGKLAAAVVDRILGLPAQTRTDAMRSAAPHLDATELPRLMARALASEEPLETGKAILKAAAEAGIAGAVLPPIRDTLDIELRLRMLGAWAGRMSATQPAESAIVAADMATGAQSIPDPAIRIDVLRAAVAACESIEPLQALATWARTADPDPGARILSAAGARADRIGRADLAETWLREASSRAESIPDEKARASVQRNVQEGLKRVGVELSAVAPLAKPGGKGETAGTPPAGERAQAAETGRTAGSGRGRATRHVLALVDTYEGGLGDVHLRAVARAAPLCDAFGLDLALVGFPVKDAAAFVKRAGRETNVGEGRGSLEMLLREGRLHLVAVGEDAVPDFAPLGVPV
ncbi:MAG: DUF531 family protein, partial [Thermoplasmatota archaeon]